MGVMDDREQLLERIARLEASVARQEALIAEQADLIARQAARIVELEDQLRRRGKKFVPKANIKPKPGVEPKPDRRTGEHRTHPGQARPEPVLPDEPNEVIPHDVTVDACPDCGGAMAPTGEFTDHLVEEIPQPRVEVHRYRRQVCRCEACGQTAVGRSDLAVPGSHVGERVKLLATYGRAHLGISLGKTCDLLRELFGLRLSTAAASGHLQWFAKQFDPVVQRLLELLRESSVVHADETGWRVNGKNTWCWCFSNPQLAIFLIEQSRSARVVQAALGDSLPGVLVTDFYAAYHAIDCRKQRCLVHLLRELAKLRDELPAATVAQHIRPLIALFQDAIALAGKRRELTAEAFAVEAEAIRRRFGSRWWRQSRNAECQRIYNRLRRHRDQLLTFLDHADVPPDNNAAERDIRSVAAARSDGGVSRTDRGAKSFAIAKSIVRTCRKNGRNFFEYALAALSTRWSNQPLPLPLADSG